MPQTDKILLRSSPSEDVTPEMGILLGHALAMDHHKVVVGMDLMRGSQMMREALKAGLLSSGADVIDLGTVSCPALALAASKGDCAVYVTEYRGHGMTSGYLLINPNGSLFRKEQIRHLDKYLLNPPALSESGKLGHVLPYLGAVEEYNTRLRSLLPEKAECSVTLDCACGPVADSAPQILNSLGADVLALNAQRDPDFVIGEMDRHGICTNSVRRQVESEPGSIGCSMNRIGTMTAILDEKGRELLPEQVFALTVMFLKPRKIAVPIDTTMLVDDAFRGKLDDTEPEDPEGLVMTDISVAAVCEAVAAGAELGFYDGGIIFGDMGVIPDGIHTAAVMAGMAGGKSINKIVDDFPEYLRDMEIYECQCSVESFRRSVNEVVPGMEGKATVRTDAWRVDMEGGWYMIRLNKGAEPSVEIVAESRDRAYLIGLMEIAGNLVNECGKGQ